MIMVRNEYMNEKEMIIRDLQDEFGVCMYDEIIQFMYEITNSDADFIILMGRRFLDMYLEFSNLINLQSKGKVISNLSMVTINPAELREGKIFVADDTMLHGRALYEVYKYLVGYCGCKQEQLTFKVFLKNMDRDKINPEEDFDFDKFVDAQCTEDNEEWKWKSTSVINSFMITGQPYVSFLPYFEIREDENDKVEKLMQYLMPKYEMTMPGQRFYDVKAWLLYDDVKQYEGATSLVRIYHYKKLKKYVIIPYFFAPALERREIITLIKKYIGKVITFESDWFTNLIKETNSEDIKEDILPYTYNLLIYTLSKALGQKFVEKTQMSEIVWDQTIEQASLYCSEINVTSEVLNTWIETKSWDNNRIKFSMNDKVLRIIDRVKQENQEKAKTNPEYFIQHYYLHSGMEDEKLVKNMKRLPGLNVSYLFDTDKFKFTKYDCWKEIIHMIDTGRATLVTERIGVENNSQKDESKKMIFQESLLKAGEQSVFANEMYMTCFAYPLAAFSSFHKKKSLSTDIKDELIKIADEILEKSPDMDVNLTKHQKDNIIAEIDRKYKDGSFLSQFYRNNSCIYEDVKLMQDNMEIIRKYQKKRD